MAANSKPLSTIFLGNGSTAPSFIAQVLSSDSGLGGASGFLGFGGGDGGVFGSSTFSSLFSRDVPGASEMNVFSGSQGKQSDLNQGLRGCLVYLPSVSSCMICTTTNNARYAS